MTRYTVDVHVHTIYNVEVSPDEAEDKALNMEYTDLKYVTEDVEATAQPMEIKE